MIKYKFLLLCLLLSIFLFNIIHAAEVTLQWNPVADADGYKVYYGTTSRIYQVPEIAEGQTADTHTLMLDPGSYYFAVTAYNNYGESGYSEESGPAVINYQDGDFDRDGDVDGLDLAKLAKSFGR